MFVACSLPAGLTIEHNGQVIALAGAHTGLDADALPKNGSAPDDYNRVSGYGLTEITGAKADAFMEWADVASKGHGPVSTGAIVFADSRNDVAKEARSREGLAEGFTGMDPAKDLPAGVETADDQPKKK